MTPNTLLPTKPLAFLCFAAVSLASTALLPAQNPRRIEASFTRSAPTIDGVVSPGEWDDAPVAGEWGLLREPETARSGHNDRARFLWDDQALYILYESNYANWSADPSGGAEEQALEALNTGLDFSLDSLNIYIDPNTDGESLDRTGEGEAVDGYQIAFSNFAGDGWLKNRQFQNTAFFLEGHVDNAFGNQGAWEPPALASSELYQKLGATGGVVEFALYWSDLTAAKDHPDDQSLYHPMAPDVEDVWIINICRITSDPSNLLPIWSWQPSQSFATPPHGELVFAGRNDTARFGVVPNVGVFSKAIEITNDSATSAVTITSVTPAAGRTDLFTVTSFPASLAPGASGILLMEFAPTPDVVGRIEAVFDVISDAVDEAVVPQVFALANVVHANGLISHYRMDEDEGSDLLDASGYGRHGTYNGPYTLAQPPLASGNAVRFEETGQPAFAMIPAEAGLPALFTFSASFWVQIDPSDAGTLSSLLSKGDGGDPFALLAQVAADSATLIWGIAGEPQLQISEALTVGTSHHLVLVHEDSNGKVEGADRTEIYVDGELAGTVQSPAGYDDSSPSLIALGALSEGIALNGLMDDVQLYDRPISGEEALYLFEHPGETLPASEAPEGPVFLAGTSRFTGGDAGEGLDLDGEFVYAVNLLGPAVGFVRDADFTDDSVAGFVHNFANQIADWHAPGYGDTPNDNALETVMQSIRWSEGPARVTLNGLTPGLTYQLQLLFAESCCNRGWNVSVENQPALDAFNVQQVQGGINNTSAGARLLYLFEAIDSDLQIDFTQGAPFPDNNPILNGLTLERLDDDDGDLLPDDWELSVFGNLDQTPLGDPDSDGLNTGAEYIRGTNPLLSDTDSDGLSDGDEVHIHGTGPLTADSDGDGLEDGAEINTYGTNPLLADTDGDDLSDGDEVLVYGTNPLAADSDLDGFPDGLEVAAGSDPANRISRPAGAISISTSVFTGGDPGEGLDLDGEFLYAINLQGPAAGSVRDAIFTGDAVAGFSHDFPNEIGDWHAPAYGDTINDNNLELVMQSIRWNAGPADLSLAGLDPGKNYKLQLLFAESCCDRGWDILLNGLKFFNDFNVQRQQGGINNTSQGVVVTYSFTALSDSLSIGFLPGTPFPDNNPILNGLTLEQMPPPLASGLAAYWDFNAGAGGVASDVVNSLTGNLLDGAAYTADAGGRSGQSGDFGLDLGPDNGGQRVEVPSGDFLNQAAEGDAVTFSFWQKLHAVADSSSFWAVSPSSSGGERGAQAHTPWSNGDIFFDTAGCCDPAIQRLNGNPGIDFLEWHHFAFVKNGATKQIWIDGDLFLEGSNTGPLPQDFTRLVLGSEPGGANSLQGVLDDFAVFGLALDGASIALLAAGTRPDDLPPAGEPGETGEIESITRGLDGSVEIAFPSEEGRLYDVEHSETLEPETWETITAEPIAGTGGAVSFTDSDPNRTGSGKGFYRTVLLAR
ncbi:MAG TPA: LamG-like jellyroll fold domain-containing protein [Verrucomicrobiales bacterium]|nr:LamG-like jellyroll fold domain-containing protein [Verrucomicrobiales bacterium]